LAGTALTLVMLGFIFFCRSWGRNPDMLRLAKPYYLLLCASYLPFMLFFSIKQFFEGIGNTRIAMNITLTANVNIGLNYCHFW
jgi:multidrug resistance protein, MATE family